MKKPVDPVKHLLMLDKLTMIGLLDARLHTRNEAGLIVEHAGNCLIHQLLDVLAIGGGHLPEPRFNVGREMYFHAFEDTGSVARSQSRLGARHRRDASDSFLSALAATIPVALQSLTPRRAAKLTHPGHSAAAAKAQRGKA